MYRGDGHTLLIPRATFARSWRARLVGLLAHRSLPDDEAMILPACDSIHTIGMRFPIDAVFIDAAWRVVRVTSALPPGRFILPVRGAWGVVELAAGQAEVLALRVGDQLRLVPSSMVGR